VRKKRGMNIKEGRGSSFTQPIDQRKKNRNTIYKTTTKKALGKRLGGGINALKR